MSIRWEIPVDVVRAAYEAFVPKVKQVVQIGVKQIELTWLFSKDDRLFCKFSETASSFFYPSTI